MKNFSIVGLMLCVAVQSSLKLVMGNNMCGVNAPDPNKHCVSLRLPWQNEPMYFCVEKEKFRYRQRCFSKGMGNCGGMNMMRNDTLILDTPWDCCPFTSVPDHCLHMNCAPPPHNRKCEVLDPNKYSQWDCCPKYFCETGMKPENCRMKRLEPTCVKPPKGKNNCVGFIDSHGCCNKYQCDGEGKPGLCPMQHQAMQMAMRFNSSMNNMMNSVNHPPASSVMNPEGHPIEIQGVDGHPLARQNNDMDSMRYKGMECVGDSFCPGTMKCCSNSLNVYVDGRFMMRHRGPTFGYCTDPIMMAPISG